jgi:hypothetical protein
MTRSLRAHALLDVAGAGTAMLCAVHCAASGVFVAVLPIIGVGALLDERVELVFLAIAVTLGLLSLGAGWRAHRRAGPMARLGIALIVLLAVRPLLDEGTVAELACVLLGAGLLVSAHVQNLRLTHAGVGALGRAVPAP